MCYLKDKLSSGERSLAESVIRFSSKLPNIPVPNLPNCFHEFGNRFDNLSRKSAKRPKIKVQPESRKRRKTGNGSSQRQESGRKLTLKPHVSKIKRRHDISENIRNNLPVSNKPRQIMKSLVRQKAVKRNQNTTKKGL